MKDKKLEKVKKEFKRIKDLGFLENVKSDKKA